jgi:hypothetical protein
MELKVETNSRYTVRRRNQFLPSSSELKHSFNPIQRQSLFVLLNSTSNLILKHSMRSQLLILRMEFGRSRMQGKSKPNYWHGLQRQISWYSFHWQKKLKSIFNFHIIWHNSLLPVMKDTKFLPCNLGMKSITFIRLPGNIAPAVT